jgi:hypothetical protein
MSKSSLVRWCVVLGAMMLVGLPIPSRGQAPATQPAADIELAKPPKYPQAITPVIEGGALLDTHHGEPMLVQEFLFNPATHELSLAKDSPVKQRTYGDSLIDSSIYNTDLSIFDYLTTDRTPIGKIVLLSAKKKLTITYNYVVHPTVYRAIKIDPASYRAHVQFAKGEESNKPGTTLTMRRNSEAPTPLADTEFVKINRKADVITWTLERGGAVVKSGSFGFPVVATEPDLVKYVIQLP